MVTKFPKDHKTCGLRRNIRDVEGNERDEEKERERKKDLKTRETERGNERETKRKAHT
jgi:hypothetical protein